jgi:hypothetical protein
MTYSTGDTCWSNYVPVHVGILPVPDPADSIHGQLTVCVGDHLVSYHTDSIPGATSYQWSYSGTGAHVSGTGKSVTVNFDTNATGGWLYVQGYNHCYQGIADSLYITVDLCIGIDEKAKDISAVIIPNPNPGKFNIEFSSLQPGLYQVKVINAVGQLVYNETRRLDYGKNSIEMDLSAQPPGDYYLYLTDDKISLYKAFIINK